MGFTFLSAEELKFRLAALNGTKRSTSAKDKDEDEKETAAPKVASGNKRNPNNSEEKETGAPKKAKSSPPWFLHAKVTSKEVQKSEQVAALSLTTPAKLRSVGCCHLCFEFTCTDCSGSFAFSLRTNCRLA